MTLENCKRLLKHFEEVASGKHSIGAIAQAKEQIIAFKLRIIRKEAKQNVSTPVLTSGKKPKR